MKMLEVKELYKNYKDIEALNGISFDINKGDFVALLGPNGAGKSTTINILCTLLRQTNGEVSYGDLQVGKDDAAIRHKVGVVFQDSVLDDKLSIKENLLTRGSLYGYGKEELTGKVEEIINVLKINDYENQYYGQISGGQRRRADIARALLHDPELLILDEPTTGLDPSTRKLVWETLDELRKQGLTIILTTHYMEETAECDNVIIINEGNIITSDTPENLRLKYSHDRLRLMGELDSIKSKLKDYEITNGSNVVEVKIKDSLESLQIIEMVKEDIKAFEVIRGNMDDVFLNLTGTRLH